MSTYVRKTRYQNPAVAGEYDKRFLSAAGQVENHMTLLALAQALQVTSGVAAVLDMPCGTGRLRQFFVDRGYIYTGADISLDMMRVAQAKYATTALVQTDAEHLPFADRTFDCVVCVRFLTRNVPRTVRLRMLQEAHRVSKQWLILQSRLLKFPRPSVVFKRLIKRMVGGDISHYQIERELAQAGWTERCRVPIQHQRQYIGAYAKDT
jgi:ubiquinone/menaquinone biosynthesis C-methylase UbiE